jgi:hypothetical protein
MVGWPCPQNPLHVLGTGGAGARCKPASSASADLGRCARLWVRAVRRPYAPRTWRACACPLRVWLLLRANWLRLPCDGARPMPWPGARARWETRRCAAHACALRGWPARAVGSACCGRARYPVPLCAGPAGWHRAPAGRLRPRGGPSRARSRWPAWCSSLRVFLREYGESLRERIRQPGSSRSYLLSEPARPFAWWLCSAWSSCSNKLATAGRLGSEVVHRATPKRHDVTNPPRSRALVLARKWQRPA